MEPVLTDPAPYYRERLSAFVSGLGIAVDPTPGLPSPIELLASYIANRPSPATRGMYESDLKSLLRFLARKQDGGAVAITDLLGLSEDRARAYLHQEQAHSAATVIRKLSVARGFYAYLSKKKLVQENPFDELRPEKKVSAEGTTPMPVPHDVGRLLAAVDPSTVDGARDRLIIYFLFNMALRVGEVSRVRKEDLVNDGGHLFLTVLQKGGRPRKIPFVPETYEALEAHLKMSGISSGYLFRPLCTNASKIRRKTDRDHLTTRSIMTLIKKYARLAGFTEGQVKRWRTHMGRVYAINMGQRHIKDATKVQRDVGHESLNSTNRYIRHKEDLENHTVRFARIPVVKNPEQEAKD